MLSEKLKKIQQIGELRKSYEPFGIPVVLTTLTGQQNLKILSQTTNPDNELLRNREYIYNILARSIVSIDGESFPDPKECLEFLKGCNYIFIDELSACYDELIEAQRAQLEGKYGTLKQTIQERKLFEERLALLTGGKEEKPTVETQADESSSQ